MIQGLGLKLPAMTVEGTNELVVDRLRSKSENLTVHKEVLHWGE